MTEKTELLKSAIDEIDRVLLGNKSADVNEVYLNNAKRFISESMQDITPPFAVGEYYSCADVTWHVTSVEDNKINFAEFCRNENSFNPANTASSNSNFCQYSKPATAEQIAEFKRAQQFASKGRKWSEFKKGDKVLNNNTGRIGIVESVDEDGDAVVNYNSEGPLSICDYKCTGALYLDLIQTAEELQEVEHGENI